MKTIEFDDDGQLADWLLTSNAVRMQANAVLERALKGETQHFSMALEKMDGAAACVANLTRENYPDLKVPPHARWRHFMFEGEDRWQPISETIEDAKERARIECELAIISVLLDAGAGAAWRYRDHETGNNYTRSEGLALASLDLFTSGIFHAREGAMGSDLQGLASFDAAKLASGFQVNENNPLEGLEGRAALIRNLADTIQKVPSVFGQEPRLGNIADYLESHADNGRLDAATIVITLLHGLGHIWTGRPNVAGRNLGDTWVYDGVRHGLIPFHKLSQWLAYSLFEPLQRLGLTITNQKALTGLAEYRNGGLFIDAGVLVPNDKVVLEAAFKPADPVIIEWRALTVALLDQLADAVRARLDVGEEAMPLASILQGGTWAAGRKLASEKRPGGPPPIALVSDGSVF